MGHFTNYKIDHRSKRAMLNFIETHRVHADSLYVRHTIAHNVRIGYLNMSRELVDSAYTYIAQESWFVWDNEFDWIRDEFVRDHNDGDFTVYQAGRSAGWLELHARGARSVFDKYDPEMDETTPIEDIRYLCNVIEDFDRFCDYARDTFIEVVRDFADRKAEQNQKAANEEAARLEPAFPL